MKGVHGGGISLLALCEFEEHYEATVGVPPHTMIGVKVVWPAGMGATWHVELTVGRWGWEWE